MRNALKRTLAILSLLFLPAMGLCLCGLIGSTGENAAGPLQALGQAQCHDHAGGTPRRGPERPCGPETCRHCPTNIVIAPQPASVCFLHCTVLPICGGFSSTPAPEPSAARDGSVACDPSPSNRSRTILELNCC